VAIAAGWYHGLALKSDGTVWAWGRNDRGQAGDGKHDESRGAGPGQRAHGSGGDCRRCLPQSGPEQRRDGLAWGYNSNGQLGDGSLTDRLTPVQASGLTGVVAIAAGGAHSLALKSDGTVWAWGLNGNGQLGDGSATNRLTPVPVSGLSAVMAIACGGYHSLALKSDGTVWAWGYNAFGELGDGTATSRLTPIAVSGLTGVVAIAADGGNHSMALKSDGTSGRGVSTVTANSATGRRRIA